MTFWLDALGAEVRYYDAGGIRTRTLEAGEGEPLVLMHGLTGHVESFVRNVVPLAEAGFHVYAIDAIGHGFTSKPADVDYLIPTLARHLADFLDAIEAEQAHILGQSLGAWTASYLALESPERLRSLIATTGAGILLSDEASLEESKSVHEQVRTVTQRALEEPTRERVQTRLEWLMASPDRVPAELVDTRFRIFNLPDSRETMGTMSSEVAGEENRSYMLGEDQLAEIAVPTLFVWTDKNPTTPASVAERAAKIIPNARFRLIEDAGHWPQFEKPEEFNRIVADFLRGI
jgi:pimeloyl-ACP methyl ester carboxylesterase